MSKKIAVALGARSYDVWIESQSIGKLGKRVKSLCDSLRIIIVTDRKVARLYGKLVRQVFSRAGFEVEMLTLDLREGTKNLKSVKQMYQRMLGFKMDRSTALLALGGGVVGDVTGFAAATYLRGVSLFQVPTTLLAQVDASIGGKVGVNFGGVKNLVGAFHQPKAVFIDPRVLATLPKRELLSGAAEVVKYGVIMDPELFELLEEKWCWSGNKPAFLSQIIERCVRAKASIVKEDEQEKGRRSILNFGHTLGHAIELECEGKILHGEAVALGMAFASALSFHQGRCSKKVAERVINMVGRIPVPIRYQDLRFHKLWKRMVQDKKRSAASLRMVLLDDIGKVNLAEVDPIDVKMVFQNSQFWWRKKNEEI